MHKGKYVFAQLLDFTDKDVFLRLANKYDGNSYVKQFTFWNQIAVLMFGQLSNRESLRDVVLAIQAHASKAYHLGFGKHAAKSTLADANTKRDYRIFEEFAYKVIRGKTNNDFKPMKWKRRFPPESGILSDAIGYMAGQLTMEKYPDKIRRVIYLDKESRKKFTFFTNTLTISLVMVAELYHNRWQIELFFKWIKQHLKIKKFWGTSENAARIQIYSAIIAYCMMAIVQKKMNIERSIYEMLQIVSISLTDTINLKDLFAKPNYNIVNELNGSTEPSLF